MNEMEQWNQYDVQLQDFYTVHEHARSQCHTQSNGVFVLMYQKCSTQLVSFGVM